MIDLKGARVVVAGAGALGLAVAVNLARAGAKVTIADPAGLGENASGVAAGMLAPAFETALDSPTPAYFPLLKAARDLWPAFAEGLEEARAKLDLSGALWVDITGGRDAGKLLKSLSGFGAAGELISAEQARGLQPGLSDAVTQGVFTAEDWRLEPREMLKAMSRAAKRAGAVSLARSVAGFRDGKAAFLGGEATAADALVIATGFGSAPTLAPELARLSPVKGQILAFPGKAPKGGPAVRTVGGYCVPTAGGAVAGATMETGRSDLAADPAAVARLRGLGASLFPALRKALATPRAGVRAATPDGLPLVGPSARDGVFLACGARRNGWLMAPLVAEMVASYLAGRDAGPYAAALDARRFDRA